MSFCSSATTLTAADKQKTETNSPQGSCYQTTVSFQGVECTGATGFKINGTAAMCTGSAVTLPAAVMGGYCFQFSASDPAYAALSFY